MPDLSLAAFLEPESASDSLAYGDLWQAIETESADVEDSLAGWPDTNARMADAAALAVEIELCLARHSRTMFRNRRQLASRR